jgi:hypothetical protein
MRSDFFRLLTESARCDSSQTSLVGRALVHNQKKDSYMLVFPLFPSVAFVRCRV